MEIFNQSIQVAINLILSLDRDLFQILILSLKVSSISLIFSALIGFPIGALLGITNFRGRSTLLTIFNAMMGLPPVVVGLIAYLMLSRSGPLGWMNLLYSPEAMIIAQTILIVPIIIALSAQTLEELDIEYKETFISFSVPKSKAIIAYIYDARPALITIFLAGFGRAISEVGAVIIVGGNIDNATRVMTTAIALETSKGNLALALALGFLLLTLSLVINGMAVMIKNRMQTNNYR